MMNSERIIVGMGVTGLSCARYFRSRAMSFSIADSRENPAGLKEFLHEFPEQTPVTGAFALDQFVNAQELIVSPGISVKTPAIQAAAKSGVKISGDIDVFSREAKAPIVAVTGSNGKSTVVSLLGEMARTAGITVAVGGNLDGAKARPALDLLGDENCELYILELSSFQLETTPTLGAKAVAILNISEDHMDRYDSIESYSAAKHRIFNNCETAVVNRNEETSQLPACFDVAVQSIGLDEPATSQWGLRSELGADYVAFGSTNLMRCSDIKIPGKHNLVNALTALALGDAVGIPRASMVQTLTRFPGLPHRCQWVRNVNGVDYFDDSKGTNVGASVTAINSVGELIEGRVVLIAGGQDKDSDFAVMRPVLERFVALVVLIGRDALKLADAFKGATDTIFAETMVEAVKVAANRTRPGDAVLLSPACASFDMFRNFSHRGEMFCAAVQELS